MQESPIHRHGFVFGVLMLMAAVLTAGMVFFPKGSVRVAEASQACPFVDGDGGTAGIQVTANATVSAVPTPGDYYDCTASDVTIKSGVTVTLNTNTANGAYAEIHFNNLVIESTGALESNGKGCVVPGNNHGSVPDSANICVTSGGLGSPAQEGGGGGGGGGGGNGGIGGSNSGNNSTYGGTLNISPTAPAFFGSSGASSGFSASGGTGGGVVRIDISGTFTHDGTVSANGNAGTSDSRGGGGGAGGSIYVTTAALNGAGIFEAKGGNGGASSPYAGGGGGGGRIGVVYNTGSFSFSPSKFDVSQGAAGVGGSSTTAVKGTVFMNDNAGTSGSSTDDAVTIYHGFSYDNTDYDVTSWTTDTSSTNQYCTVGTTTPSVTATTMSFSGAATCSTLGTNDAFVLTSSSSVTLTGFTYTGPSKSYFNINGGPAVSVVSSSTLSANFSWVTIASLNIDNSVISANGYGCTSPNTNSASVPDNANACVTSGGLGQVAQEGGGGGGGGGGGNGGIGGSNSGNNNTFGGVLMISPIAPNKFGSSGAGSGNGALGGTGGGIVRLDVSGAITNNGTIRANGNNGTADSRGAGGGSGGSIYITSGAMNGTTGTFEAKGGDGGASSPYAGGGGGGGRIAIIYHLGSFDFTSSNLLVNAGSAGSGGSSTAAAKGTVYTAENNNTTGTATDDTATIFHGFSFDDTDYSVSSWMTDSSATNQYCFSGTTTPSVTATTISLSGAQTCSSLGTGNIFALSSSGTVALTGLTYTGPAKTYFNISGGAAVIVSSSTIVTANMIWVTIASLTVNSGTFLSANGMGCTGPGTNNGTVPDSSNVCVTSGGLAAAAQEGGGGGGGGGGGHGGVGGSNSGNPATGGGTYDSASVPAKYGASGAGSGFGAIGAAGGGVIRIDVTDAFTNNGTLRANGSNGTADSRGTGGGAGGSMYITTGSAAGSTGVLQAVGGNGGASSPYAGGGGGGGRIAIEYGGDTTSGAFDFNDGSDTIGGFGASTHAAGGAAGVGGSSTSSSAGSILLTLVDSSPVVTVVTHTPSSPTQTQAVTLSGTATDGGGVTSIQIYLDGTAPANLKKTCTQAATSPVTCTVDVGVLSYGSHTTTIRASDGTNTTDGTETFTVGGPTQSGTAPLSRLQAGATSVFTLSFAFQSGTHSGPLTVTFPSAFTINSAAQGGSSSACLGSFAFDNTAKTLSATKTSCTGTITLGGASITNPGTPGSYTISWVNDDPGSTIVAIVDSDQVSMSASVDPFITVNIGSQAAATACDGTFAGNGGALALGSLSASTVTSSDASSVPHICIRVSTNSTSGAVATVKSTNAALKSTSTPADTIDSATASPLATNTAGYGLCVGSAGGDTGTDSTAPTGASPVRASPFNGTCTSAAHNIGALTTGIQSIFTLASPTQNAFARIYLKAGISTTTKAHTDYGDTLTFIVTGTF